MRDWSNRRVAGLAVMIGLGGFGPAAIAGDATTTGEKEFILYSGANLKVMEGEEKYPVIGISRFSVSINRNGKTVKLPYREVGRFWIDREMKLNNRSATIHRLQIEKVTDLAGETTEKWGSILDGGYTADQGPLDNVQESFFEDNVALKNRTGGFHDSIGGSTLLSGHSEAPEESFEGMEVRLELSSEDSITDPYVVLVTDFHDPSLPDRFFRKFMVQVLDRVGREPASIRFRQGGFPAGFEVDDSRLYLYSRGREVPTNLSEKQIALTTDEAFQYLVLEYLVGHRGETLAPRPMWVKVSTGVGEEIRAMESNPQVRLILDRKGRVVDLAVEGEGLLPPAVAGAFRAFRFYPALEGGKPVGGSFGLRPGELVR